MVGEEVQNESAGEADMITKAHIAAERLEKANAINAELVKKMEGFEARKILGGQSDAGQPQAPVKEETPQEYAKRIMSGKL